MSLAIGKDEPVPVVLQICRGAGLAPRANGGQ